MQTTDILKSWSKVLRGHTPMLSIEVTRECPLHCPGCYAYGSNHLGGEVTLRELSDKRGDELVAGVLGLINQHKPMHVTLVGGEPMVRHRELSQILPVLSKRGIFSMVVSSGIIPFPIEWMTIPRFVAAVSVDGLPEHHNVRRHPATYEKILANLEGRQVNIHLTITAQMLGRSGYLEEYARFWSGRPEVRSIWVSLYTPQRGEQSAEMLTREQRVQVARELSRLYTMYPKLLTAEGYTQALLNPPASPKECSFSRLSKNYSADLKTHVEPCVFGGDPDCSQCGCVASVASHWVSNMKIAGPLTPGHIMRGSMGIGNLFARVQNLATPWRQREAPPAKAENLVQITDERVA